MPTSPTGHPTPGLAADALVLRPTRAAAEPSPAAVAAYEVLLVRRGNDPFKGAWALPGGFVDVGEPTEAACRRELLEETGIRGEPLDLLGVYDDPARDPRGHVVSVVYVCRVSGTGAPAAGSDAADAGWFPLERPPELAFDHPRILKDAAAWLTEGGEALLLGE